MLPVSDKTVWDLFFSQFHFAAASVADEVGLFSVINNGIVGLEALSENTSISARGIESLCLVLKALGLLNKKMDSLSEIGKTYYVPSSPYYWGAILKGNQKSQMHQRILAGLCRQGNLELQGRLLTEMWKRGDISVAAAKEFTARMNCMGASVAEYAVNTEAFTNIQSLLDVGGGSGVFARAFLSKNPDAYATVFDLAPVIEEAKLYQQDLTTHQNIRFISGNFFKTEWPQKQEAILLANILHDWSFAEGRILLEKAYDSLQDGGRLIIHEMLRDDELTSEINTAFFDLLMYVNHGSQQYTKNQLMHVILEAGFNSVCYCYSSECYGLIYAEK